MLNSNNKKTPQVVAQAVVVKRVGRLSPFPLPWVRKLSVQTCQPVLWLHHDFALGFSQKVITVCRNLVSDVQGPLPPNSHDATLNPPWLPPLCSPTFSSPPLPSPLTGSGGMTPGKFFRITDAHRRVLEHFGHKNQHLYEPGILTGSCMFRISSKCACSVVNRWRSVCDHLTEIPSFCWVIAAC